MKTFSGHVLVTMYTMGAMQGAVREMDIEYTQRGTYKPSSKFPRCGRKTYLCSVV
jgi:hypothetical protein